MIETVENHSGGDGGALESCKACCCLSLPAQLRVEVGEVREQLFDSVNFYFADHYQSLFTALARSELMETSLSRMGILKSPAMPYQLHVHRCP
jgi:hypothetical protein